MPTAAPTVARGATRSSATASASPRLLHGIGGRVLYTGDISLLALGRTDELWDTVAVVEYPSRAAFFRLATSPEYLEVSVHRDAGLEGQLLLETTPGALRT